VDKVDQWKALDDTTVHIWYTMLNMPEATLRRYTHLLSMDERHRAAAFRFDDHRWRWVTSRLYLRVLLGRYLACEPQDIQFRYGEAGKPFISGAPIQFNLSHTQGMLGFAIAKTIVVGIDVEHINPATDYLEIARGFFAPSEVSALAATPALRQGEAFFRMWTRKEAYLKATGRGIAEGLAEDAPTSWTIETFALPAGHPDHLLSVAACADACQFERMPLPRLETLL
jgi:4'-phosphopantetheinyl transferase